MIKRIEQIFENALWNSRLMVVLAVGTSVAAALLMTLLGVLNVWEATRSASGYFVGQIAFDTFQKYAIVRVIAAVDAFLIATVLLIFGFGLYELFVSRIDPAEQDTRASKLLIVRDLPQLKAKLASVIVMVLVVTFFKEAMRLEVEGAVSLLAFGGGIVLCAAALTLMARAGGHGAGSHADSVPPEAPPTHPSP